MSTLKIEFQEIELPVVMEYFIQGFEKEVKHYEYFIDPNKNKVVLKLFIEEVEPKKKATR